MRKQRPRQLPNYNRLFNQLFEESDLKEIRNKYTPCPICDSQTEFGIGLTEYKKDERFTYTISCTSCRALWVYRESLDGKGYSFLKLVKVESNS